MSNEFGINVAQRLRAQWLNHKCCIGLVCPTNQCPIDRL